MNSWRCKFLHLSCRNKFRGLFMSLSAHYYIIECIDTRLVLLCVIASEMFFNLLRSVFFFRLFVFYHTPCLLIGLVTAFACSNVTRSLLIGFILPILQRFLDGELMLKWNHWRYIQWINYNLLNMFFGDPLLDLFITGAIEWLQMEHALFSFIWGCHAHIFGKRKWDGYFTVKGGSKEWD